MPKTIQEGMAVMSRICTMCKKNCKQVIGQVVSCQKYEPRKEGKRGQDKGVVCACDKCGLANYPFKTELENLGY